jgi:acetyl/propionyl-CoA carboxylase alpha subunit
MDIRGVAQFMTARELHWRVGGLDVAVRIEETSGHGVFHIGGRALQFSVLEKHPHGGWIEIEGRPHRFYICKERNAYAVWFGGRTYRLERGDKGSSSHSAGRSGATGEVTALMPGKVLRIDVAIGDSVLEKQTVAVMESMKMETPLLAPKSGRVTAIHARAGDVVDMGALMIVIEE